jgi:hypothetical protein
MCSDGLFYVIPAQPNLHAGLVLSHCRRECHRRDRLKKKAQDGQHLQDITLVFTVRNSKLLAIEIWIPAKMSRSFPLIAMAE